MQHSLGYTIAVGTAYSSELVLSMVILMIAGPLGHWVWPGNLRCIMLHMLSYMCQVICVMLHMSCYKHHDTCVMFYVSQVTPTCQGVGGTVKEFRGSGGHNFFKVIFHYICYIYGNLRVQEVSWCLHIICCSQHIMHYTL